MADDIIDIDDVSLSFDGGRSHAVEAVSVRIPRGSFLALVGGSGSGKTTLLKTINRLVEPTGGCVRFEGRDVAEQDGPDLRRRIGYVFQGIGLFPHMSVGENIGITPDLMGWSRADIAARVDELLDLVELPRDYARRAPAALSGGQRQRIGLARALAARPPAMLMDEPFGALDPLTRDALGTAYRAIHDKLGLTTIMVTHDVQEALLLADRIAVMSRGRLVALDTPQALMAGQGPAMVREMMEVPRRQAERVHALSRNGGAEHG